MSAIDKPITSGLHLVKTSCYFCGRDSTEIVRQFRSLDLQLLNKKLDREGKTPLQITDDTLQVVRCKVCGLVYQDPRPSEDALRAFYETMYGDPSNPDLSKDFMAYRYRSPAQEEGRLKLIHRWRLPPGRLLDVGCGHGFFLAAAQAKGWDVFGVEYSKSGSEFARHQLKLPVQTGEITAAAYNDNYFDVIVMHSVLEHVLNPRQVLETIYRKLRPGGYLFFNVPNTDSLELRLSNALVGSRYAWYTFEHLHYHNRRALQRILQEIGYIILGIDSRHFNVDPYVESPREEYKPRTIQGCLFQWIMRRLKRVLEFNDMGARLCWGNIINLVAQKKS